MKKALLMVGFATLGLGYNSHAQTTLSEDFEGSVIPAIPATWTQATLGTPGWTTRNIPTNFAVTILPAPSTYVMLWDYGSPAGTDNSNSQLISPTFSIGSGTSYLRYDHVFPDVYVQNTTDTEHAFVQLSTDGGTSWTTLEQVPHIQSLPLTWETEYVNLSAYNNSPNCKLKFVYSDAGNDMIGIALDNVNVYNAASADLAITAATPAAGSPGAYGSPAGSITLGATIANHSSVAVSSFTVNYTID